MTVLRIALLAATLLLSTCTSTPPGHQPPLPEHANIKPAAAAPVAPTPSSETARVYPLRLQPDTPSACPLHKVPLQTDVVPGISAFIDPEPLYFDAMLTAFPYANSDLTEVPRGYTHAQVLYCTQCRAAEDEYFEKYYGRRARRDP